MASLIGLNYIKPNEEFLILAGKLMCRDEVPTQIICENLLFLIMGYGSDQLNSVRLLKLNILLNQLNGMIIILIVAIDAASGNSR